MTITTSENLIPQPEWLVWQLDLVFRGIKTDRKADEMWKNLPWKKFLRDRRCDGFRRTPASKRPTDRILVGLPGSGATTPFG